LSRFVQIFVFSFTVGLTGAMTPGPLLAFTVHQAAKKGYSVGFLVVLGHAIIESSLVIAIFVGAAKFLQNKSVLRAISAVGAVVMGLLALLMLNDARTISLSAILSSASSNTRFDNSVLGGIVMSGFNPTFPLWWATVGLALVAKYATTVANGVVFYAGHVTSDLIWYGAVSCAIGFGRHLISDAVYRCSMAVLALALAGFAVYFAYAAVTGSGLQPRPSATA